MTDLTTLYDETVKEVAACADEGWEHIIVNYEMRHVPNGIEEDRVTLYVHKTAEGKYELEDFRLSNAAKEGFRKISDALYEQKGSRWGASTLTIENNGTYNFNFSYDPPKRLTGVHDEESYDFYNNYLDHYLNERVA